MPDPFKREMWWLTQGFLNHRDPSVRSAARRLRADPYHPGWRADLDVLLAKTWAVNAFGFYTSSLRAQGAAVHIEAMLKKQGAA